VPPPGTVAIRQKTTRARNACRTSGWRRMIET
jgi:hypothetical protein